MQSFVRRIGAGIVAAALFPAVALAQYPGNPRTVTGPARAVNADTMQVGTTYVFLWALESVEKTQICAIGRSPWTDCYDAAVRGLETIIGVAPVTCTEVGPADWIGRWLATCTVAGEDVGHQLVRAGWALAKRDESDMYVADEEAAHAEHIGLWQGEFQPPKEARMADGVTLDRP
jgi:endonuclease YncB( thermonuclease family)